MSRNLQTDSAQTDPAQTDPAAPDPAVHDGGTVRARAFGKVLVANRGEIACRVIKTLAAMGIRSVAVYSEADRRAKHVGLADEAVNIGPAAPASSYLNIDAIIRAARATGAQAVHPGYGFLSENQEFARALERAGIVFIGPGVHALTVMGDKIRSKNHVAAHQVPVTPGIAEPGLSDEQLIAAAEGVGYPLLIKPSAGGGGKGMHTVERPAELPAALATARRIAASAFGDDTLFLERLIASPRHIEVQILADAYGHVIHLGERECSLQRRHQKVIEEAPSPLLDEATRARIGAAACEAARSVDYIGAGTVEFLVSDAAPDEFFFMEMNTRLQVEHPVTEMVTGMDLVEWQVRIAAGERLTVDQDDVVLHGHAIEARVYAENPQRDFLPSAGTILALQEPTGAGIRVDSSLLPGQEIAANYDPMLAKVIAWGTDRAQALTRLDAALGRTMVLGVATNVEYLRLLITDEDVAAGRLDTTLIERKLAALSFRPADERILAAAALFLQAQQYRASAGAGPWGLPGGWRIGVPRPTRFSLAVSAAEHIDVLVTGPPEAAVVVVGDGPETAAALLPAPDTPAGGSALQLEFGGISTILCVVESRADGHRLFLGSDGHSRELRVRSREEELAEQLTGTSRAEGSLAPEIRSPMPGTVTSVAAATGDSVEAGQPLLTVEAMKMEHQLIAAVAGIVSIAVKAGDLVKADQIVATVDPDTVDPATVESPSEEKEI